MNEHPIAGRPLRILVVDDQRDVRHVSRVLFGAAGHQVEAAPNAREASAIARRFLPHLIMADLRLPDRGQGQALARMIRSDEKLAGSYLIALTGSAEEGEIAEALSAGFDEVVRKPLDYGAFLDRLASIELRPGAAPRPRQLSTTSS